MAVPPAPTACLTLVEDVFDDLLQVRSFVPLALSSENAAIPTPASYTEAVSGPHSEEWLQAITTELEAFARNGSYVDVPRPPHTNVVKGKWVFRVKNLPNEPPVFKARYCAKGFTQKHGVDFFDTFSPTAKLPTVRALLDLAARSDFEVHSMDVSNAFLQGNLREQIFMERPQGFTAPFPSGSVWQLRRPVYGLKQAPLEWNRKLTATLTELGFGPSSADPCLFVRAQPSRMFIIVYVDDMIIVAEDPAALTTVKQDLSSRLLCKDLGELKHYLGMEMTRDRAARTISLSQSFYVNSVLQRFGMVAATPVSTPIELDHQLAPATAGCTPPHPYPELVGSLMYAMMCTRPDLAYAVSVLSRFVGPGRHGAQHWAAAQRVLRYLRGTSSYSLVLGGLGAPTLMGFGDSSWADCQPDRRSTQGYCFSMGSGAVSWRSTRSSSIALSSTEAELYAATMAAQEARWLTYLLAEFGCPTSAPVLYCDNASTIHLAKEPVFHARSKHIEARHFFVREQLLRGHLRLCKIAASYNLADIFTKPLSKQPHRGIVSYLGLSRGSTAGGVPLR